MVLYYWNRYKANAEPYFNYNEIARVPMSAGPLNKLPDHIVKNTGITATVNFTSPTTIYADISANGTTITGRNPVSDALNVDNVRVTTRFYAVATNGKVYGINIIRRDAENTWSVLEEILVGYNYSQGDFVDTIKAEETAYTNNARNSDGYWYVRGNKVNIAPTVTLTSPSNNQTLYENDTLNISGEAYDTDKDQSVTAYYQINSEARKVLATNLSQMQIPLSKQLKFKGGKLYDGDTVITGMLVEGVAHKLKVWAVDNEGAQSTTVERTFYVVPNRAPLLSVDEVVPSGIIDLDKFKVSGKVWDEDANSSLKVTRRINAYDPVEIYSGPGGDWEFEVSLAQLVVGENIIIVEVIDNYGAKASKTIKLNKDEVKTPILQSVARYKIFPPKGSAKGVLMWIQRDKDLDLTVELSMTLKGEQEQYVLLELDPKNIIPVTDKIVEDEYYHETAEPKDNIILKLTTTRANVNVDHKIYLVMGVVE